MIQKLKSILRAEGVENYLIREEREEALELYFIKRRLDTKRSRSTCLCTLSVYRDHTLDGKAYRGSADVLIFESMDDAQITQKIREGYAAAAFVKNPPYPLAPAVTDDGEGEVLPSLASVAEGYARALYLADTHTDAFVNSAEIFTCYRRTHIVNSLGLDVRFGSFETSGELVVQCKGTEDAELFDYFCYSGEQYEALCERVKRRLCEVRDRSEAVRTVKSGKCDIILEGECVREMLGYALWQADAQNIHTGYSSASVGEPLSGKLPDITACAVDAYSAEGVRMRDRALVQGGVLACAVGGMRFSSYLGTEPTGEYRRLAASSGERTLEDMKRQPHLYIVSFSDFQFDPLDGYFGGEVRLAYYFDGERTLPVTGCSISGNYERSCADFEFSRERYTDYTYDGPLALKIKDVTLTA